MRAWLLPLALCLALVSVPALAQSGTGTLHGTVCMDDHAFNASMRHMPEGECWRETVPFAQVHATREGGAKLSTEADEDGFFMFPDLAIGTYQVEATAKGFSVHAQEANVVAGQRTYLVLRAEPAFVDVAGQVVDEASTPLPGAMLPFHGPGGSWNVTTDGQGGFSARVPAGWHHTWVDLPGFQRGSASVFIDGSSPIKLMLLHFEGSVLLQGKVVDQDGDPVAQASIDGRLDKRWTSSRDAWQDGPEYRNGYQVIADPWDAGSFRAVSDADGRFEVQANPGPTHINVWAQDHRDHHQSVDIPNATIAHMEFTIHRLPARDAHITGTVVDAETGDPVQNFQVEIDNRVYHQWFCSTDQPQTGGCPIVANGGAFAGSVMPGYSIMRVWAWEPCKGDCHREPYISHVETLVLESGQHTFAIELQPRPRADAIVSGYVLDAEGQAVDAHVNFHNEEGFGYGGANADAYGSYRVQLVEGMHRVSVWAPGFFPWEGMIKATSGQEKALDIRLVEDPDDCCAPRGGYGEPMPAPQPMPSSRGVRIIEGGEWENDTMDEEVASDENFVDLGGLGQQYDAAKRNDAQGEVNTGEESRGVPAWGVFGIAGILAAVVLRRR